jgi:hypothetical protein
MFLMFTAENCLNRMYSAPYRMLDPGSAGTIYPRKQFSYCPVVTAAAEARTLEQPYKAGIVHTVVLETDGGDLTLTVTGGYNADADTSITFADAGDFVTFLSIKVGTSFYWRVLAQEGTNVVGEDLAADQATIQEMVRPGVLAAEHGAGAIGTAFAPRTYRYTREGVIITEIHVDITGLACKGDAAKDAIGLAAGGAAYIGRYVTATCGIVFRIEMICLELPGEGTATITADIDLGAEDTATTTYDQAVDDVVINTASLVAGEMASTDVPALTANDYLYLVEGDTAATTGVYNAGQYIIRLYGHALLA